MNCHKKFLKCYPIYVYSNKKGVVFPFIQDAANIFISFPDHNTNFAMQVSNETKIDASIVLAIRRNVFVENTGSQSRRQAKWKV